MRVLHDVGSPRHSGHRVQGNTVGQRHNQRLHTGGPSPLRHTRNARRPHSHAAQSPGHTEHCRGAAGWPTTTLRRLWGCLPDGRKCLTHHAWNPAGWRVNNSARAIQDYYVQQGWTDGLPVVPATEELVREVLGQYEPGPVGVLGGNPAPQCSGHAGKGGGQRRHGRVRAGTFPGGSGRGKGRAAGRLQLGRRIFHHRWRRSRGDCERSHCPPVGRQRRHRVLWPRSSSQRSDRPGAAVGNPQRWRADSGGHGQGDAGVIGPVHLLLCRERGPESLGAAALGAGFQPRRQHRHRCRNPGELPGDGDHRLHRGRGCSRQSSAP